jgi:hypothetical protein
MSLPNPGMDSVPFTPLTAEFLDDMIENINSLAAGTGFDNNAVPASALATTAITLGYTQITTNFSTGSTSAVQVTGLACSVTIPSGGRKVEITAYARDVYGSLSTTVTQMTIWDGTVGSGTQLQSSLFNPAGGAVGLSGHAMAVAVVTPSAGAKTYNVGFQVNSGTGTLEAASTFPAFILVKVI